MSPIQSAEANTPTEFPVRILLQWMPQAQFAGYIMAAEQDFFAKEGVDNVSLLWTNLGEVPLRKLAQNDVEFATGWLLTALQRRAEGLPIVNVAQYMQRSASMIVVRKGQISKPEDLNGKIILSWGGDFAIELSLFLHRFNIKPAQIFPLSDSLAPFLSNVADGMQAMAYNEYLRLLERGLKAEEMLVFEFANLGLNFVGDGLYTSRTFLAEHPNTVRAVRKAVTAGWHYAFSHEEETINAILKYCDKWQIRTNRNHQLEMLRTIRKVMEYRVGPEASKWGSLSFEDFESAKKNLIQYGLPLENERFERFHTTQ